MRQDSLTVIRAEKLFRILLKTGNLLKECIELENELFLPWYKRIFRNISYKRNVLRTKNLLNQIETLEKNTLFIQDFGIHNEKIYAFKVIQYIRAFKNQVSVLYNLTSKKYNKKYLNQPYTKSRFNLRVRNYLRYNDERMKHGETINEIMKNLYSYLLENGIDINKKYLL